MRKTVAERLNDLEAENDALRGYAVATRHLLMSVALVAVRDSADGLALIDRFREAALASAETQTARDQIERYLDILEGMAAPPRPPA